MRIVQTFWTAGQDPLKHAFGWLHPEYNLMSWALSCLSLREHYDEVALYTDSEGKRILIDKLHLPYTEVNVVFDDFPCLPQHWALAKIKTYSLQTKPFLHVDGDVYVSQPFSEEILTAPLVAQNREIGTIYYRRMMERILSHPTIVISDNIKKRLEEESIASYNMGMFGGSDITFIKRYCEKAFHFMDENCMNNPECEHSGVWCNIFFEQVFLAAMVDEEGREVASVLGRPMKDEGYTNAEFCNLARYEEKPFFHLLGGHKSNVLNCEMLGRTLLRLYPDYFHRLIYLFPKHNRRLSGRMGRKPGKPSVQMCMAQYEDFLEEKENAWKDIPLKEMLMHEQDVASFVYFIRAPHEEQGNFTLRCCPYIAVFEIPSNWRKKAVELLRQRFSLEEMFPLKHIAAVPTLLGRGLREVPVVELQMEILALLQEHDWTWQELRSRLMSGFTLKKESLSGARLLILNQTVQLLQQGIITAKQ